jgi:hypothetical protein
MKGERGVGGIKGCFQVAQLAETLHDAGLYEGRCHLICEKMFYIFV